MKHHDFYLHFLITSEVEYISILAFSCTLPVPLFYDFNWLLSIWYLLNLSVTYLCILCAVWYSISHQVGFELKCSYNVPGTGAGAREVGGPEGYLLSSMVPEFCWPLFE